jgi:hypothetical protein
VNYAALLLDESVFVVPRERAQFGSLRDLHNLAKRDGYAAPRLGTDLYPILKAKGWEGKTFDDLTTTTPELLSLHQDARQLRYSISGFSVSLQSLPIVFGLLFLLGGLLVLGPFIKLLADLEAGPYTGSWVFAVGYSGRAGRWLAGLQAVGLLVISIVPLYYAYSLRRAESLFGSLGSVTLWASELASVVASGAILCFVVLLGWRKWHAEKDIVSRRGAASKDLSTPADVFDDG